MTVQSQARYASASARNVKNFLDRFNGVNRGTPETRKAQIAKLLSVKDLGVDQLKHRLGVRPEDHNFDNVLLPIISFIDNSKNKLEKSLKAEKAGKSEKSANTAEETTAKSDAPLKLTVDSTQPVLDDEEARGKTGKSGRKKITLKGKKNQG